MAKLAVLFSDALHSALKRQHWGAIEPVLFRVIYQPSFGDAGDRANASALQDCIATALLPVIAAIHESMAAPTTEEFSAYDAYVREVHPFPAVSLAEFVQYTRDRKGTPGQ